MLIDLLQEDYGDVLGEEGQDYLQRIHKISRRMQTLVKDLLAFSRVTTKARTFSEVNLNQVVKDVLSDLEAKMISLGGSLQIEALPTLEADPLQMRQLFQNLLDNAFKFHQENLPPQVKIYSLPPEQNQEQIVIQDNGIGFEPEQAIKIFEPFHRLHSSSQYEGTGFGLAICQRIVERHGGSITASSEPGKGAAFTITLPIKQTKIG